MLIKKNPKQSKYSFFYNNQFLLLSLLLVVITFFCFSPVLNNEFVNYDDNKFIYNNDLIKNINAQSIVNFFEKGIFSPFYKPLVYLSWSLEYNFFKLNPAVYHLDNLLLHIINVLLVFIIIFFILRKLYPKSKNNYFIAFIIAVLFAIHPMKVESVAWAMERKDVLFSFFFLTSLLCYIYYYLKQKYWYIILGSFLFGLGLLCKSMIITLPFVLFIIDYLFKRKLNYKLLLEKIPYFVILFVGFYLFGLFSHFNIYIQGLTGASAQDLTVINLSKAHLPFQNESFIDRLEITSYRLIFFISHLIYPQKLSVIYSMSLFYPVNLPKSFCIYPVIVVLVAVISLYSHKYTHIVLASVLFYLITIFPVLAMQGSETSLLSDRYTYIPCIGLFFLIGIGYKKIIEKRLRLKIIFSVILTGYILFLSISAFKQTKIWRNSLTLWGNAIKECPSEAIGYYSRGKAKKEMNDFKQAIDDYNKAVKLKPCFFGVYISRADAKCELKDYNGAIKDFNKVIELKPDYLTAYIGRGNAKIGLQDYKGAIKDFNKVIKLRTNYTAAYYNRGNTKYILQDYKGAIKDFNKVIKLRPNYSKVYNNRGNIKYILQDYKGAIKDFNKVIKLKPDYPEAYYNRGLAEFGLLRYSEAMKNFNKAIKLKPDYAKVYYKQGLVQGVFQNDSKAVADFNKAIKLNPDYTDAYFNRGIARYNLHNVNGACNDWRKAIHLGDTLAKKMIQTYCK